MKRVVKYRDAFQWVFLLVWLANGLNSARAARPLPAIEFVARTWTKADGLPQNSVTAVLQSRDGFLWVGTPGGLVRFDGVSFQLQKLSDAGNQPVAVTDLCEDGHGHLWVGTRQHGLFCLASNVVSHLSWPTGFASGQVTCLAVDAAGNLWIGTHLGLGEWNGRQLKHFTHTNGLPDENVSSIFVAREGSIWITTRAGVCVWRNGKLEPYKFDADSSGRSPEFLGVYEDRQKNLWAFGDTYLINLADPLGNRLNNFRRGDLTSSRLWSFCETRDGRLWVGTSGQGLLQFTGDSYQPFRPVSIRNGKMPKDVRSLCEDTEGNLWLGTENSGLVQLHQERMRQFGEAEGLPTTAVSCLTEDAAHRIWAMFSGEGLFYGNENRFESCPETRGLEFIRSITSDTGSNVWFAVAGSGVNCWRKHYLVRFTSASGLEDSFITAVGTFDDMVWAGSRSGQIYSFQNGFWRQVAQVSDQISALLAETNQLFVATDSGIFSLIGTNQARLLINTNLTGNHRINGMCLDEAGHLWAATDGGGLICWINGNAKKWTAEDGLPDDQFLNVIFDPENNLWLTTTKGIYCVEKNELQLAFEDGKFSIVRSILPFSDAPMASTGWPAAVRASDGQLWFATGHGLVRFDPRGWHPASKPPPVYIESMSVNGNLRLDFGKYVYAQKERRSDSLKLSSSVRSLDFDFTAPCLASPEKARFRHRLEGFDEAWIESGSDDRHAHYGTLPSGNYRFQVIACNADGTWNQSGVALSFVVPPPWWRLPWVMAAFAFCAAALIALAARLISHRRLQKRLRLLEQNQAMTRERMRIAQDMHDEIGSKLARISFLSAGLNNELSELRAHSDKAGSIADTSHDLLQSLDQMVWAVNPSNDSLENLVAYCGQYATEYFQNTSVQCDVRLPQRLPSLPLSAEFRHNILLGFQEALGNTLKHSHATTVVVEIRLENQVLEIRIADNGTGFKEAGGEKSDATGERAHHGLSGMKHRLQLVGGECQFNSATGRGTVVKFSIPLKTSHK